MDASKSPDSQNAVPVRETQPCVSFMRRNAPLLLRVEASSNLSRSSDALHCEV